ncbi:MAG: polyphosphate kinase 1 [Steroidobacteraceae bacterium]
MAGKHMDSPAPAQLYINRELSLLAFNERVLAQALDPALPLLERLRFLCICSGNLDEFFEIRVAGLKQLVELGTATSGPDRTPIDQQLDAIHERTAALMRAQYACLEQLLPALRAAGVWLVGSEHWSPEDRTWLEKYFRTDIEPVLSPLGLDPARPFPRLQNKSLNFVVQLSGKDAFGRDSELAIVQAPRSLPRVVPMPKACRERAFVLLSAVVAEFIALLFPGVEVHGCWSFRVTRNSDLFVDDEEVDDLRRAVEGELAHRRYGAAVRLETSADCPPDIVDFLLQQFSLGERDHYTVSGPVNLNRLSATYDLVARSDLKFPPFAPAALPNPAGWADLFAQIREGDLLLHHPFQGFAPVMDFLRSAAADPAVLAIKQTLYRTGADSPIVDALVAASQAGKDVTAIIELRARFDEEANIAMSTRLQEAGVHVMYGVVGYKTHAKMILVVRREESGIRRYCHLGTGNYHQGTARAYTDYGLLTCNEAICTDVHELFLQLTSLTRTPQLRRLLQSPFTLHARLMELIARETQHAARRARRAASWRA